MVKYIPRYTRYIYIQLCSFFKLSCDSRLPEMILVRTNFCTPLFLFCRDWINVGAALISWYVVVCTASAIALWLTVVSVIFKLLKRTRERSFHQREDSTCWRITSFSVTKLYMYSVRELVVSLWEWVYYIKMQKSWLRVAEVCCRW